MRWMLMKKSNYISVFFLLKFEILLSFLFNLYKRIIIKNTMADVLR